jgi:hypothetical protein
MGEFESKINEILSSPAQMEKLIEAARSLTGGGSPTAGDAGECAETAQSAAESAAAPIPDPKIFKMITRVMGVYSSTGAGDKGALLGALRPYLRDNRRECMERAVEIVKLTRLARAALSEFSGGDVDV